MPRSFLVKKTERRWTSAAVTAGRWTVSQCCPDDHHGLTTGLRDLSASVPTATDNVLGGPFFGLTSASDGDDTLCQCSVADDPGKRRSHGNLLLVGVHDALVYREFDCVVAMLSREEKK